MALMGQGLGAWAVIVSLEVATVGSVVGTGVRYILCR